MKILSRITIPAAILLLSFSAFAQTQSYKGEYEFASDAGIKLFLETDRTTTFTEKNSNPTASAALFRDDAIFSEPTVAERFAGRQQFQKIKIVSEALVKSNLPQANTIKLSLEDEETYKKKSSFWNSDLLYFAAGVAAATAAYFLISGTSEATSSRKTFGYPPPPSN